MRVCFVCKGNICRSPVAQLILTHQLETAGLPMAVTVSSAGLISYHAGKPVDERARAILRERGYPTDHSARHLDDTDLDADLIVAMDRGHQQAIHDRIGPSPRIRLLRSFDPSADADLDVPDPYYQGPEDFVPMVDMIENAIPGLLRWLRTHTAEVADLHRRRDDARRIGKAGDDQRAAALFAELLPQFEKIRGTEHDDTLDLRNELGL